MKQHMRPLGAEERADTALLSLKNASPLTYFKDHLDFIFYIHRFDSIDGVEGVRATLVYYPMARGTRRQLTTNNIKYGKFISDGLNYEIPFWEKLPSEVVRRIKDLSKKNHRTQEEFLFVPADEVVELYDPTSSLNHLLNRRSTLLDEESFGKLNDVVSRIEQAGIPRNKMGLYGGLQAYLVKMSREGQQLNDIDILVKGVKYYPFILKLCKGNKPNEAMLSPLAACSPIRRRIVSRRWEVSQFRLNAHKGVVCDLRILRLPEDDDPLHCLEGESGDYKRIYDGFATVVEASGSLSLPVAYRVQLEDNTVVSVLSRYYHAIAAAQPGDRVRIRGVSTAGAILLFDPVDHFIYPHNE